MLSRRFVLGGLIAAPAVVSASQLMPLRGTKYDPIVTLQTWPVGQEAAGEWWRHTGPLSRVDEIVREMKVQFGRCFWGQAGGNPAIQCDDKFTAPQEHVVSEFGVAHGVSRQDGPTSSVDDIRKSVRETQDSYFKHRRVGFSSSGRWFLSKYCTVEQFERMEAKHDLATENLIAWRDKALELEDSDTRAWLIPMSPRVGERRRGLGYVPQEA